MSRSKILFFRNQVHTSRSGNASSGVKDRSVSNTSLGDIRGSIRRSPAVERAVERRKKRLAETASRDISGKSEDSTRGDSRERVRTRVRYVQSDKKEKNPIIRRILHILRKLIIRIPFVAILGFIALCGLSITLWLSSQSARGTYESARLEERNKILHNRADELEREMAEANSAPVIANRASKLGMVPASEISTLIYRDGKWIVRGTETPNRRPPHIASYRPPHKKQRLNPSRIIPGWPEVEYITYS